MATIQEMMLRAQLLRQETALDSISPERAGGIMYDTLAYINQMQLQGANPLLISKIYASVAAMEADTAPVSDLTGQALRPGQVVVIASADSDNGAVYRYNGGTESRWTVVGKIGNLTPEDSLTSDSTQLPLAAHQGKVLDGKITALGHKVGKYAIPIAESGKFIKLSIGVGNTIGAPETSSSYSYMREPVKPGDFLYVNGQGGANQRLWGFVDAYGVLLAVSGTNVTGSNLFLVAPANAAEVIINTSVTTTPSYRLPKDSVQGIDDDGRLGLDIDVYNVVDSINEIKGSSGEAGIVQTYSCTESSKPLTKLSTPIPPGYPIRITYSDFSSILSVIGGIRFWDTLGTHLVASARLEPTGSPVFISPQSEWIGGVDVTFTAGSVVGSGQIDIDVEFGYHEEEDGIVPEINASIRKIESDIISLAGGDQTFTRNVLSGGGNVAHTLARSIPAGTKILVKNENFREYAAKCTLAFMDAAQSVVYGAVDLPERGGQVEVGPFTSDVELIRSGITSGAYISSGDFDFSITWGMGARLSEKIDGVETEIDSIVKPSISSGAFDRLGIVRTAPIVFDYNIILGYGQSLSVGTGIVSDALSAPENALMLEKLSFGGSSDYADLPNWTLKHLALTPDTENTQPCPPSAIAVNNLAYLHSREVGGKKFIHICTGLGGATIAQLMDKARYVDVSTGRWYFPGISAYRYTYTLAVLNRIKAIADAEGKTCGVIAVNWNQGEEDYGDQSGVPDMTAGSKFSCNGDAEEYKDRFLQLQADFSEDCESIFGQALPPAWFIAPISGAFIKSSFSINQALAELPDYKTRFPAPSSYPVPNKTDGHPIGNGYRWYGEYLARANYEVLMKGYQPGIMRMREVIISGNKVIIHINVPVAPIRVETKMLAEMVNYGFYVYGSYSEATIEKFEIIGDTIVLTTDRELVGAVRVEYGTYNTQGVNVTCRGEGNICDSARWNPYYKCMQELTEGTIEYTPLDEQSQSLVGKDYPMYNFLQPFKVELNV